MFKILKKVDIEPSVGTPIPVSSDIDAVVGSHYAIQGDVEIKLPDPSTLDRLSGFVFNQVSGTTRIYTEDEPIDSINQHLEYELETSFLIYITVIYIFGRNEYFIGIPGGSGPGGGSGSIGGGFDSVEIVVSDDYVYSSKRNISTNLYFAERINIMTDTIDTLENLNTQPITETDFENLTW